MRKGRLNAPRPKPILVTQVHRYVNSMPEVLATHGLGDIVDVRISGHAVENGEKI